MCVSCISEGDTGGGVWSKRGGGGWGGGWPDTFRTISEGVECWEMVRWEGEPSRTYAVSAPADQDASQLYYSYRIISEGWWNAGEMGMWVERS